MKALIAEISNHHMGNVSKAFDLIKAAKDCGATHVKMQAINKDAVKTGSMPVEFYEKCSMDLEGYSWCIEYGKTIGIPVFFSIFGDEFEEIFTRYPKMIRKIAAGQVSSKYDSHALEYMNNENTLISLKDNLQLNRLGPSISKMAKMYATDYCVSSDDLIILDRLNLCLGRPVGLSDHSIGIDTCVKAITENECTLIEKHFYLGNEIKWDGQVYRDCHHSANPKEFEKLAKIYRENV